MKNEQEQYLLDLTDAQFARIARHMQERLFTLEQRRAKLAAAERGFNQDLKIFEEARTKRNERTD